MANGSNSAFCMENSDHKSDMLEAFDDYLMNESMVDVMVTCEGHTIKAHKIVLSAGSGYFRTVLSQLTNALQFPVLIIKDMPFDDLKAIIKFLYKGKVVVPIQQVTSLSNSAQTLDIKGLKKYYNNSQTDNVVNNHVDNTAANRSSPTAAKASRVDMNGSASGSAIKSAPKKSLLNLVNTSDKKCKKSSNNEKNDTQNESKRSIGMSLRTTRRQNYRQLSNGDFNSDDEFDFKGHIIQNGTNGHKSRKETKRVKRELNFNENNDQNEDSMPQLEAELSQKLPDFIDINTIDDENQVNSDDEDFYPRVEYQSTNEYEAEVEDEEASAGNYTVDELVDAMEPPALMRNPLDVMPRRTKQAFISGNKRRKRMAAKNNRLISSANGRLEAASFSHEIPPMIELPMKGDPDQTDTYGCDLCPRSFGSMSSLHIHCKRLHGDHQKDHICYLCGKKYSWKSGLYKHLRTHRTISD